MVRQTDRQTDGSQRCLMPFTPSPAGHKNSHDATA